MKKRFFKFAGLFLASTLGLSAAFVPIAGPGPVALDRLRVNNPALLPMTGMWKFQLTHGVDYGDGIFISTPPVATASSASKGNPPGDAIDRNPDSCWTAKGDFPQWWQIDLGGVVPVRGIRLHFQDGENIYRFTVEGSTDGSDWKMLTDQTAGPGIKGKQFKLSPMDCRFVRIDFQGGRDEAGKPAPVGISEAEITVLRDGAEVPWRPAVDPATLARDNAFTRTDFQDAAWSGIPVPANWEMEGFSKPTYNQPDDAVGLYRRWIDVPAGFAGKHVLWHFDGAFDSAEVFVNGVRLGYHESGFTAFDIDVTSALKPGRKNLFAVRVCKSTTSVDLDTGDFWSLGGIYRETYLLAVPPLHVDDVRLLTDLDGKYVNATLNAAVAVRGVAGQKFTLSGRLYTLDGADAGVSAMNSSGTIGADGSATVTLTEPVSAPKLWSAEKPNLYYLVLGLSGDSGARETVQERFGFHKVEIRDGVVLWNGVRIKAAGTCRHEMWAALGHALNEAAWRRDIQLMKDANINAVRTSHYNDAQRFMELCSEKGLYVIDEVPGCWTDPNARKDAWLQRTRETFNRDKDRPCVLAWSIGNESGLGSANLAAYELMKRLDPTRPALISRRGPAENPELDLSDYHYPSPDDLRKFIADPLRATHPFVITEGPHVFCIPAALTYDYGCKDFWGMALDNQWKLLWSCDSALGGFIWEWQDQGLADKFPDKEGEGPADLAGTEADTGSDAALVDKNERPALRKDNYKGIVDGYRNIKPEIWNVKMVYSPVTTDARTVTPTGGFYSIPLQNRYSFTDLSELACNWQALAGGKTLASGHLHVPCPPLSTTEAKIPVTPGAEMLAVQFVHPDGRTVYSADLRTPDFRPPLPPAALAATGPVTTEDSADELLIHDAGTRITLDKKTGRLRSWKASGQDLVLSGPVLNLGELRPYHNEFSKFKKGEPPILPVVQSKEAPQLRNVSVTVQPVDKKGSVVATVSGDVYLVENPEPVGALAYTLTFHPDARIDVAWKLTWKAAAHDAFELGMTMDVPNTLDTLGWFRDTLWTCYPPGHIGAPEGTVKNTDLSFRCSKLSLHWAALSGAGPVALTVLKAGSPLDFRARKDAGQTVLFLSSAIGPSRDFSTNLVSGYEIHLLTGQTYSGAFTLAAAQPPRLAMTTGY